MARSQFLSAFQRGSLKDARIRRRPGRRWPPSYREFAQTESRKARRRPRIASIVRRRAVSDVGLSRYHSQARITKRAARRGNRAKIDSNLAFSAAERAPSSRTTARSIGSAWSAKRHAANRQRSRNTAAYHDGKPESAAISLGTASRMYLERCRSRAVGARRCRGTRPSWRRSSARNKSRIAARSCAR